MSKSSHKLPVSVRPMSETEIPDVLGIEVINKSKFRWRFRHFYYFVSGKHTSALPFVAVDQKRVVGFMMLELFHGYACIQNIGVNPYLQRMGIGSRLLQRVQKKLRKKMLPLMVRVRESDDGSRLFFEAHKLQVVTSHRGWFKDTGEDAYEMWSNTGAPRPGTIAIRNRISQYF